MHLELVEKPKRKGSFNEESFHETDFFSFFDQKEDAEIDYKKLFENGNLLDDLNHIIDEAKNESMSSGSDSENSKSEAPSNKGFVT